MTNETILKKAIEKAVKNGWKPISELKGFGIEHCLRNRYYRQIIFSHDFAKAFWKDAKDSRDILVCPKCKEEWEIWKDMENIKYCLYCGLKLKKQKEEWEIKWEFFLKKMVLEKEPLKYLEKFI